MAEAIAEAAAAATRLWRWMAQPTDEPAPRDGRGNAGPDARFFLGTARPDTVPDTHQRELPSAYGRNRAALLARDPRWLFAFWEITPEARIAALRSLDADGEGAREIMRVLEADATGAPLTPIADIELTPGADCWHVEVPYAGRTFLIEIGLRTASGRFVPLARSNTATTPPETVSGDLSVAWAAVGPRGLTPHAAVEWSGRRVDAPASPADASSPTSRSSNR